MAVHRMKLRSEPFLAIASGRKTVEMRLLDEKRRLICPGDMIVFADIGTGRELTAEVESLHRFPSFRELYDYFPKSVLGYAEDEDASYTDMEQYYPPE